ncbi:hypothetical protein [Paludibaculum fermentans]|uniref:Uncharacterized protein n=1 Tax=Paludibaculum fermentans TaxID=1473598 RepID=A0A7S7SL86_PALFE|nr:hypothetical protein [Paludibaculum fermentans]QOY89139.1 hypothetical protein IRI77_04050 [Paludibaculum fermentans]
MHRWNSFPLAAAAAFLTLSLASEADAQILASQPELCGHREAGAIAPPGITTVPDESSGTQVTMQLAKSVVTIHLPGVGRVEQVCPNIAGKTLLFGRVTEISFEIYIVDSSDGRVLDKVLATTPAISPDQHWLAYRAFWPRFSDLEPSEEYLLYDLTGDAARNTAVGMEADLYSGRGFVLYPRVADGKPFSHAGLPPALTHVFRADALRWSEDSKSLVFADSVEDRLSVVMVSIGKTNRDLTQRTMAVTRAQVCGDSKDWDAMEERPFLTLSAVARSGRRIALDFRTLDHTCPDKSVLVSEDEFQDALMETPAPPSREGRVPVKLN